MMRRFLAKLRSRLRPWLGLPLALVLRDLWPTTVATLCLLGPAALVAQQLDNELPLLVCLVPIFAMLVSVFAVELGLPELSGFRQQQRRPDATPQMVFYLVKALGRLERRPWLERMFWVKPRFHRGSLRSYLHAQLLATHLRAGQLSQTEAVLAKVYQHAEERGALCHHNEAVFWSRLGDLENARRSVEMSRALGLKLPGLESRLQYRLESWLHRPPSAHLLWLASVGELYQQLGFHQAALRCLELHRGSDSDYRIVSARLALGQVESAEKLVTEARQRAAHSPWTWLASGTVQLYRGQIVEARASFEKGMSLGSCRELKTAFHDLQIQHTPQNQLPRLLEKISQEESDPILRLCATAHLKSRLEQWEESIQDAMAALGMGSRDITLLECLGHSWCRLGVHASGLHFLRRFHELVELRQPVLARREKRLERARSAWDNFGEDTISQ